MTDHDGDVSISLLEKALLDPMRTIDEIFKEKLIATLENMTILQILGKVSHKTKVAYCFFA